MDWRKKIALAVVVIGAGLGVALQFRKSANSTSEASPAHVAEAAPSNESANNQTPVPQTAPRGATSFAGGVESAPASGSSDGDTPASASAANNGLVDLNAPQQTHKIADGDTLPQISQQYLGRADRYMEIFNYNRDVLNSPDVLPIGAELRIPSRLALPSDATATQKVVSPALATSGATATTGATTTSASKVATPPAPMVPLITPAAKPASTQSTAATNDPHKYKVQPGDNLVDIARKVYGDGRRNTDLYEANRLIMRNPGDLKPGMVLTVP